MIVPMIKYDFLLFHQDLHHFLESIQDLGLVDIERHGTVADPAIQAIVAKAKRIEVMSLWLKTIDTKGITPDTNQITADELLDKAEKLKEQQASLVLNISKQEKEVDEALPWNDFQLTDIERLREMQLATHFFAVTDKQFNRQWETQYPFLEMNREAGKVYFAIIAPISENIDLGVPKAQLPRDAYPNLLCELKELQQQYQQIVAEIQQASLAVSVLDQERSSLLSLVDFKKATNSAEPGAEGKLLSLTGWIPEGKNAELIAELDQQAVYYIADAHPVIADKPPILLINNAYTRLFEPITKLFSLPSYNEVDPTPFFAPFYMIFFGFCLGDGAYGIIIILLSFFLKWKYKDANVRSYCNFAIWLGLATLLFGCITGTFFGVTFDSMNLAGKLERNYPEIFKPNYAMLYLALLLGVIQILFGMMVKAYNISIQFGVKYAFSSIAWISILLLGIVYLSFGAALPMLVYMLVGGALALVIVFYNLPDKNIFINFGNSIWETYGMLSGLLGDLLSYIRLFALGMTGGILGGVFNTLASKASGGIETPVFAAITMVIILILGHTLNILLNTLGALVHPLRLTFVEFYKNSGFAGGGRAYRPMVKTNFNNK